MLKSKPLYILGYSGHAYVVIDVALSTDFFIKGYFDIKKAPFNPYSLVYYGSEKTKDFPEIVQGASVFPSVGSNSLREILVNFIVKYSLEQTILVSPSAQLSPKAIIGNSSLISPRAVINSMANIGVGCIINTGSIIEHECEIGNFAHIAPGAVLAGNVTVGSGSLIGANSVVKQGISIGKNVVVGAGAVVVKDIPNGQIWMGNPAKKCVNEK